MRAPIRDTEIYFDIDGAGLVADGPRMRERPAAFIIHGGPGGDHSGSRARYGALSDRMQLVFFDHRGQGRSARGNPAKYNLDENVEDMEALRRYLGLGPIVSIGTSYGGMVGMAHAARYPESVSHLVLIATAPHAGYAERALEIAAERGTPEQKALAGDLFAGRIDAPEKFRDFMDRMGSLYAHKHDPNASKEGLYRGIYSSEALNRAHAPGGFLRSYDLRPELRRITAPTLILAGRHDWICAPEFSVEMLKLIKGSDLRIFEDSSHAIASDEAEGCLDAIRGFIVYKTRAART